MITLDTATTSVPLASRHALWPTIPIGSVAVKRATLFAGHAECPGCHAFVRRLTALGTRSVVGELVAGWCGVCCTTTYFAAA
jgi:hypothetical protein